MQASHSGHRTKRLDSKPSGIIVETIGTMLPVSYVNSGYLIRIKVLTTRLDL